MRVFLTGGSGFVGSYAVPALLARGHEVRLLVRNVDKAKSVLGRRGVDWGAVDVTTGDMLDRDAVEQAVTGCDATVHAAAAIGVTTGGHSSVFELNTTGARNVIGAARAAGHDPVVHVSSVAVFVPPDGPVISADSPLANPTADYGRSKLATEQELRALQDDGAPITIVYPGGVLGPDPPSIDATIEGIIAARTQGWPKTSGGVCVIDVRDLAEALAAAVRPERGPRRLMLGGPFYSWAELGALLDELTGVRAFRLPLPKPVLFGAATLLDQIRKIRPLGYPLTRDAAEVMTTMVPTEDQPTLDELDIKLRPTTETLEDTIRWCAAEGHLPGKNAGRLAPSS